LLNERGALTFWGSDGIGPVRSEGLGLAFLQDRRATAMLWTVLDGAPDPAGRADVYTDLAFAYAEDEPELAALLAQRALELAVPRSLRYHVERVRGLRSALPESGAVLSDLDERLAVA
jgi:hypothetical protein